MVNSEILPLTTWIAQQRFLPPLQKKEQEPKKIWIHFVIFCAKHIHTTRQNFVRVVCWNWQRHHTLILTRGILFYGYTVKLCVYDKWT